MDVLLTKASPKVKSNIENDDRSSPPEVFLEKGVLKLYRKFTGEHPCRSVISIKLLFCNFIEITLGHGFSCTFTAYFQNIFFYEHLSRAACEEEKLQ